MNVSPNKRLEPTRFAVPVYSYASGRAAQTRRCSLLAENGVFLLEIADSWVGFGVPGLGFGVPRLGILVPEQGFGGLLAENGGFLLEIGGFRLESPDFRL